MSKKRIALILSSLLGIFLISACILWHCSQSEDKRFEAFLSSFFCQELSGNSLTLHYTLKDPSAYGLEDVPPSLGSFSSDSTEYGLSLENTIKRVSSFDRSRLSSENQLTYDVLLDYLNTSLKGAPYLLYNEPLTPLTGIQSQLPILLSEYPFYDRQDVDSYLALLSCIPDYFNELLVFEQKKSDAGFFMSSSCLDSILEECQTFLSLGDNCYLYDTFQERLKTLNLSDSDRKAYIKAHQKVMEASVFPAFHLLEENLPALKGSDHKSGGLCHLPGGKDYYQTLVLSETGSGRTIPELKELTVRQMNEDLLAIQDIYASMPENPSVSSDLLKGQGYSFAESNPAAILAGLEQKLSDNFPAPPDVSIQIKYVQESVEENLSPAFYMIPPVDHSSENVIYINRGHMPDDLTLFTTLAHEGYPGHLYQTTYYASLDPDPVRSLLNYGGYTEGWATYSEMISYYYAPLPKETATLLQKNSSLILGLYALADIGIHFEGWALTDTVAFFQSYGITDVATIRDIYELIVADPANYLKYYIGYAEFLDLKRDAVSLWGEAFSQKRFHQEILELGPASFDLLREYML